MKPNIKLIDNILEMEDVLESLLQDEDLSDDLDLIGTLITETYKNGGKLLIAGNGGSAADAQHLAAELMVKQAKVREPMAAIALNSDIAVLTATGNDFGYEQVFVRQLQGLAHDEDVFIGISTSGNSLNMVKAFEWCRANNVSTILFTGETDNKCRNLANITISIPSKKTSVIQQGHQLIYHTLVDLLEEQL